MKSIEFVGMPGSGKSTLATELSEIDEYINKTHAIDGTKLYSIYTSIIWFATINFFLNFDFSTKYWNFISDNIGTNTRAVRLFIYGNYLYYTMSGHHDKKTPVYSQGVLQLIWSILNNVSNKNETQLSEAIISLFPVNENHVVIYVRNEYWIKHLTNREGQKSQFEREDHLTKNSTAKNMDKVLELVRKTENFELVKISNKEGQIDESVRKMLQKL